MDGERLYPLFMRLAGQPVLVVGAGRVATRKIESLLECGAAVTVVAPAAEPAVERWAAASQIRFLRSTFAASGVEADRYALVFTATSDRAVNGRVAAWARAGGMPVNSADDPANCSFHVPAVLRRGSLCVAVGTGGGAPGVARRVRDELRDVLPDGLEGYLERAAAERRRLAREWPGPGNAARRAAAMDEYLEREWPAPRRQRSAARAGPLPATDT